MLVEIKVFANFYFFQISTNKQPWLWNQHLLIVGIKTPNIWGYSDYEDKFQAEIRLLYCNPKSCLTFDLFFATTDIPSK